MKLPDFSKLSRKEKMLGLACSIIVGFMVMDRLVVVPWWQHVINLNKEVAGLEHTLNAQEKLLSRRSSIMGELDRYRLYLHPGKETDLQTAQLLKEIEELAKQSQVSLEEVKPQPSTDTEFYQSYAFEVHAVCPLSQWVRFIYLIETSNALFRIERARISVKEGKPDLLDGFLRLNAVAMRPMPPPVPPSTASTPNS